MIAVYGATGHTGQLVARELVRRGQQPRLLGRSRERLEPVRKELGVSVESHVASLKDRGALLAALDQSQAVINCAGPFSQTGRAVAEAAMDAGSHYVDVTAEPPVIRELRDALGPRASSASVVLVSGAGFYCALADCLVRWMGSESGPYRRITVAYLIDGWRMTPASRATAMELAQQPRLKYLGGRLGIASSSPSVSVFDFPPPHGEQQVLPYPGGEMLTIPRHTAVQEIRVLMTTRTFSQNTFTGDDIAPAERADSSFVVVVEGERIDGCDRAMATGRDIYRVGALAAVETALTVVDAGRPQRAGALAPAEVLEPGSLLGRLKEQEVLTEISVAPDSSRRKR